MASGGRSSAETMTTDVDNMTLNESLIEAENKERAPNRLNRLPGKRYQSKLKRDELTKKYNQNKLTYEDTQHWSLMAEDRKTIEKYFIQQLRTKICDLLTKFSEAVDSETPDKRNKKIKGLDGAASIIDALVNE